MENAVSDADKLKSQYDLSGLDDVRRWLLACGFDGDAYLALNPDVAARGLTPDEAVDDYLLAGLFQFRPMKIAASAPHMRRLLELGIVRDDVRRALMRSLAFAAIRNDEVMRANWEIDVAADIRPLPELGVQPLLMFGDSHCKVYWRPGWHKGRTVLPVLFLCTASAAQGLGNPASRARRGPRIAARLEDCRGLPVFFKFGQVDAEFVSVFHRIRSGQTGFHVADFEAFACTSVARYGEFLAAQQALHGPVPFRVCAIFPPALSDESWREGYVNGHVGHLEDFSDLDALSRAVAALELPDLATRIGLHAFYNDQLKAMCARLGFIYVDDFTPMLADGAVRPELIRGHGGRDHHLSPFEASVLAMQVAAPLTM